MGTCRSGPEGPNHRGRHGRGVGAADLGGFRNGAHLLYRIDLPNDQEALAFVTHALAELDRRYSDDVVKVDVTSANAARIWKAYGTVARKGDSIPGRPHRLSRNSRCPVISRESLARFGGNTANR